MDSLRYWVIEMHVDGFRFDLASTLARELHEVDQAGGVLRHHPPGPGALAGQADRRAVGPGRGRLPGRQLPGAVDGVERQVPRHASAASGRATAARSPSSPRGSAAAATSTSGAAAGRTPASTSSPATTASRCTTWSATTRSTTRPTARTTATATDDNLSWNCGAEGPTDDPAIIALRERQKRNFLATLLLSQGVPMLRGGDELGHTQQRQQQRLLPGQRDHLARLGPRPPSSSSFLEFTRQMIRLRLPQPVFHRRRFFQGRSIRGAGINDIAWLDPAGRGDDGRGLERAGSSAAWACAWPATRSTNATSAASA